MSGAAPLVDTQNVRKQIVASRELLDTLPTSTKHINTLVTLTPGFTGVTDVGGRYFAEAGAYHGKRGTKVSSTAWASKTAPATAATRSTRRWWRRWCCRRAASPPR